MILLVLENYHFKLIVSTLRTITEHEIKKSHNALQLYTSNTPYSYFPADFINWK